MLVNCSIDDLGIYILAGKELTRAKNPGDTNSIWDSFTITSFLNNGDSNRSGSSFTYSKTLNIWGLSQCGKTFALFGNALPTITTDGAYNYIKGR